MSALEERQKIIKDIIKPALKKAGFKMSGNHFVKCENGFTKVFSVANISWNTKDYVMFDFRIGILFPLAQKIMNRTIYEFPSADSCHFRIDADQLFNFDQRGFKINLDTNISELRQYISNVINNYVVPFFERYNKIEDCIELYDLHKNNCFDVRVFIGVTLIENGNMGIGNKLLELPTPKHTPAFKKLFLDYRDDLMVKENELKR